MTVDVTAGKAARFEQAVSRVLFWGGVAGIALAVIGLALHFTADGHSAAARDLPPRHGSPLVFRSVPEIVHALTRTPPEPIALAAAGLLVLLVTPIAGLAVAAAGFARIGDRDYAVIAAVILALLIVSFALTGTAG